MTEKAITSETPEEYKADESKYFRNIEGAKQKGPSATDRALIDKHLPSEEKKHQILERYEKGFNKTSRSGAFSKPNAGPAIFPNSLKFASEFIDENTPKGWKPAEPLPVPTEQTRQPAYKVPRAEAVITDICIDCLEPVDIRAGAKYHLSFAVMAENQPMKLQAMGLEYGALVICVEHEKCAQKARTMGQASTPLVLVKGGSLTSEEDIRVAQKYNFPIHLHNGSEATLGQWNLIKRQARIEEQIQDYLIKADKHGDVYTKNRVKEDAV